MGKFYFFHLYYNFSLFSSYYKLCTGFGNTCNYGLDRTNERNGRPLRFYVFIAFGDTSNYLLEPPRKYMV